MNRKSITMELFYVQKNVPSDIGSDKMLTSANMHEKNHDIFPTGS